MITRYLTIVLLILGLFQKVFSQTPRPDSASIISPQKEITIDKRPDDSTAWLRGDTVSKKKHSPTKATLYSLVIPGLGQAYNRQYWKIPVLAGLGTFFGIMIGSNHFDWVQAERDLNTRIVNDEKRNPTRGQPKVPVSVEEMDYYDPQNPANTIENNRRSFQTHQLRTLRDSYRRERDFYIIMSAVVYALNIVDAAVFAHLREFEVTDKLSMNFNPEIKYAYGSPVAGLSCSLTFK